MHNSLYYNSLCDLMFSEETWMARIVLAHHIFSGDTDQENGIRS